MRNRLTRFGLAQNRSRFYLACAFLLLFVAAVIWGMIFTLRSYDQKVAVQLTLSTERMAPMHQRDTLSGAYLASRFAAKQDDYDAAAHYAQMALQLDEDNRLLRAHRLRLLVASGQFDKARSVAAAILSAEKQPEGETANTEEGVIDDTAEDYLPEEDQLAVLLHMGALLEQGQHDAALELLNTSPRDGMYYLIKPALSGWLRTAKLMDEQAENAEIEPFVEVELEGFLGRFLHYQRALMNDLLGNTVVAEAAYRRANEEPEQTPFRVVQAYANFLQRQDRMEDAVALYETYLEQDPDSKLTRAALDALREEDGNAKPKRIIATPAEGVAEIYFTVASLLYGENVSQQTLLYVQLALSMREDFPPAQMLLAGILEQHSKHQKAVQVYESIDPESDFYKQGRIRIALNYYEVGKVEKAQKLLQQMAKDMPDNQEPVVLLGFMLRMEDAFEEAVHVYQEAEERADQFSWDWEYYYKYGIALERNKQWDKAEAQFLKALAIEPDQPDVLNYLGYSWLDRGVKLERATHLIEKAYQKRPDAAHIIDSMGWAYYQLGNYEKARELLEEAVELLPQDPTINEHLGDVYWRTGRRIEARYQWQRALDFEPEDPQAVRRKLQSGLPPATAVQKQADSAASHADEAESAADEEPLM